MTNFDDAWFLLQHSAFPVVSGVVFFLLGLWFAYLQWHRWVGHLHQWERENRELEEEVRDLEKGDPGHSRLSAEGRVRLARELFETATDESATFYSEAPRSPFRQDSDAPSRPARVRALLAAAAAAFSARRNTLDGKT
jgi:hypothetical protein